MPSGEYTNNELGNCGICQKKMRPLYRNKDWEGRAYHITCFRKIINDIANYNTTAYTKYGVEKKIHGMPESQARTQKEFVITFDD
tara:strand:- start:224 stop:478 length:255 start_codon:yes stop_codon:yes gene_type:complete